MWDAVYPYVTALLPTIALATLFYFVIKYMIEGDRRERLAHSQWEAERARKKAARRELADQDAEKNSERNGEPGSHSTPE